MVPRGGVAALITILLSVGLVGCSGSGGGSSPAAHASPSATSSLPGLQTGPPPCPPEVAHLRQRLNATGLPALKQEGNKQHTHQELVVGVDGRQIPVPPDIGLSQKPLIISPLHTHDASGVIHVESPTKERFTLGQFFDVWGVKLTSECIGGECASGASALSVFVNGKPFHGDPRDVPLLEHEVITLLLGTKAQLPAQIPSHFPFAKYGL
jgi:hypothetical protein